MLPPLFSRRGTWVVPGSHRSVLNPRGPADGICVAAPIPGEMQVRAKAGSVFIQDTRTWHCSAMHNPSGHTRVAMVNRWSPWWLSVAEFGGLHVGYLKPHELAQLPEPLQALVCHLCVDEDEAAEAKEHHKAQNLIHRKSLLQSEAAAVQTAWGFRQIGIRSEKDLLNANSHIRIELPVAVQVAASKL